MKNINKNLFTTLCCLIPLGTVHAATTTDITSSPYPGGNLDAGSDNFQITSDFEYSGLQVNGTVNLQGGLHVGLDAGDSEISGFLNVLSDYLAANNNSFTLSATGNMTLGTILVDANTGTGGVYSLTLQGSGTNSLTVSTANGATGATIAYGNLTFDNFTTVSLNTVEAFAALTVKNVATFETTGTVNVYGNSATIGSATNTNTVGSVNIGGDLVFDSSTATGNAYNVIAGSVNVAGDVQNNSGANLLVRATNGNITVGGSIENKGYSTTGGSLTLSATGNISANTITQEYSGGKLTLYAGGNLTLNGTAQTQSNPIGASLVLNGVVDMDVIGKTTITNGWTLQEGTDFSLTTGSIAFNNVSADTFTDMFTNTWENYALTITNGNLSIGTTTINSNGGAGSSMLVSAKNGITAGAAWNTTGALELLSTGGNITLSGAIVAEAGAGTTTVSTNGTLTVQGTPTSLDPESPTSSSYTGVNNSSTMILGAAIMDLYSITNNATGTLTLGGYGAPASALASITVQNNVSNSGTLKINTSDLTIKGVFNNIAGTATFQGNTGNSGNSSLVYIGQMAVDGGTVNMNNFGTVSIGGGTTTGNGTLTVSGGMLNFNSAVSGVSATNTIDIAGDVLLGATPTAGDGNVNIAATNFTMSSVKNIIVRGNITASTIGSAYHATFASDDISVSGNILAEGSGHLTFGNSDANEMTASAMTASATTAANTGGIIDFYSLKLDASLLTSNGGYYNMYGNTLTADSIRLGISDQGTPGTYLDGLWFNGDAATSHTGMVINGTSRAFTINVNDTENGMQMSGDMVIAAGNTLTLNTSVFKAYGDVSVTGTLNQGAASSITGGGLILGRAGTFTANTLTITNGGTFHATGNDVSYVMTGAGTQIKNSANEVLGTAAMNVLGAMTIDANTTVNIDTTAGSAFVATRTITNNGILTLDGAGMIVSNSMTAGTIYQNNAPTNIANGSVNVLSDSYKFYGGTFTLGGINASNLDFVAYGADNLLNMTINGNVSGGVHFLGLEKMTIKGNWLFDNDTSLNAWIKNKNTTGATYWATVNDNPASPSYGAITNPDGSSALINIDGVLTTDLDIFNNRFEQGAMPNAGEALANGQVGITITNIVDQGDAIWLVHATGKNGEQTVNPIQELGDMMRNLYVSFCNYNGTICYNYFDSFNLTGSENPNDWPAYLSMRDTDGDGIADSIYIVFDPDFGGPVEVFKIQPIVDRVPGHTDGEYVSAGALDDLIEGKLLDTGFFNRTPIEVIPLIFKNTNMSTLMTELYGRMEDYSMNRDGTALARFSRLVQPREIEQLAGSVVMNEHITFRDFEDRMFDEFIWTRNRNLNKAWLDLDFGMFTQDVSDGKRIEGNRFSLFGGFDWQESDTLILGVSARISRMSGDNSDVMDLSYKPGNRVNGFADVSVVDTDLGLGAYLMQTLGDKSRLYGNAFLDLHVLSVSRDMTFMSHIDGTGTAFSLISEWGLMHDILNEYIVGNLYGRIGYNFGFSVNEKAQGQEYMKLESKGYMILTPGYSLIAQKRIYPSSWLQLRPYASIGVEYDVLGAPDSARFKFGPARRYTDYSVSLDPLWANIGGGIEVLSVHGIQAGLDYRYQYNQDMQLHKIKLSGSYRF